MKNHKNHVSESSSDDEIQQKPLKFEPGITSTNQDNNVNAYSSSDEDEENQNVFNNPSTSRMNNLDENSDSSSNSNGAASKINVLQNVVLDMKPKLEAFSKKYEKIEIVEKIDFENLSDNEEVSLIQMPNDVNAKELKKAYIDFDDTDSILELSCGKFSIQQTCAKEQNTLLVLNKPIFVKSLKTYTLLPYVKKKKKKLKHRMSDEGPLPIPINLKQRHPLFGADYEKKIVLDPVIERKLDDSLCKYNKERTKNAKKCKKEKMKKIKQEKEELETEPIFQLLNENNLEKKKKKKSDNSKEMTVQIKTENSSVEGDSETVSKKKKKRKIKEEPIDEEKPSFSLPAVTQKKKKHKKAEIVTEDFIPLQVEEVEDVSPKRKSTLNSTLMSDVLATPHFNPELSVIKKEKKKGKRSSTNDESDETNLKLDILNNVKASVLFNTVKKKKPKVV